ncbi:lipopolysaccharide biosynthesis protein [Mycolicibacterium pulveris]|uniref:lipopolysaccharide biosynthesis protein n=1 Tax=Mycolicibacterium pulveris TaxID=36813 RepID=UPI003CF8D899
MEHARCLRRAISPSSLRAHPQPRAQSQMSRSRPARNSAIYIGAAALQRGAPFLLLLVLAALVPVDDFGKFAVLASIHGLLTSAATFGMESVAFRGIFAHESKALEDRFYNTLVKFTFVGPIALAALIAAVLALTTDTLLTLAVGSIITTVLGGCLYAAGSTVPLARLRAQERVATYVIVVLVPAFVVAGTKFVLCGILSYGAFGWALGDLIGGATALAIAFPFQYSFLFGRRVSRSDLRGALRIGLPLLPHVLSGWTLSLSDRLVIAGFFGATAAGRFAFAAQVAMIVTVLAGEINRGVLPLYGRVLQDSKVELLRRTVEVQRIATLLIAALVAVGGWAAVAFLAPYDYRASATWIPVLALASGLFCLYFVPMNYLTVIAGRTTRMALITSSAAAVNILINVTLLPVLGIGVAAYSTLTAYLLLLVLTTSYAGKYDGTAWTGRSKACAGVLLTIMVTTIGLAAITV